MIIIFFTFPKPGYIKCWHLAEFTFGSLCEGSCELWGAVRETVADSAGGGGGGGQGDDNQDLQDDI